MNSKGNNQPVILEISDSNDSGDNIISEILLRNSEERASSPGFVMTTQNGLNVYEKKNGSKDSTVGNGIDGNSFVRKLFLQHLSSTATRVVPPIREDQRFTDVIDICSNSLTNSLSSVMVSSSSQLEQPVMKKNWHNGLETMLAKIPATNSERMWQEKVSLWNWSDEVEPIEDVERFDEAAAMKRMQNVVKRTAASRSKSTYSNKRLRSNKNKNNVNMASPEPATIFHEKILCPSSEGSSHTLPPLNLHVTTEEGSSDFRPSRLNREIDKNGQFKVPKDPKKRKSFNLGEEFNPKEKFCSYLGLGTTSPNGKYSKEFKPKAPGGPRRSLRLKDEMNSKVRSQVLDDEYDFLGLPEGGFLGFTKEEQKIGNNDSWSTPSKAVPNHHYPPSPTVKKTPKSAPERDQTPIKRRKSTRTQNPRKSLHDVVSLREPSASVQQASSSVASVPLSGNSSMKIRTQCTSKLEEFNRVKNCGLSDSPSSRISRNIDKYNMPCGDRNIPMHLTSQSDSKIRIIDRMSYATPGHVATEEKMESKSNSIGIRIVEKVSYDREEKNQSQPPVMKTPITQTTCSLVNTNSGTDPTLTSSTTLHVKKQETETLNIGMKPSSGSLEIEELAPPNANEVTSTEDLANLHTSHCPSNIPMPLKHAVNSKSRESRRKKKKKALKRIRRPSLTAANRKQQRSRKVKISPSRLRPKVKGGQRRKSESEASIRLYQPVRRIFLKTKHREEKSHRTSTTTVITSNQMPTFELKPLSQSKALPNPLKFEKGEVLYAFYEDETLIVVQTLAISFWKYVKIWRLLGEPFEWILLSECPRKLEDYEISTQFKNRLCSHDSMPVYLEMRAKDLANEVRECNLSSVYVNIYYYHPEKELSLTHTVQLDNVKCVPTDIHYTTILNSRYFVMCWRQEMILGKGRTGLCKYSLTPDLDTLASIREFKQMRHSINYIDCINDDKLVGFGKSEITIWDHRTGDVLFSLDLGIQLGTNLGAMFHSSEEEIDNYLLLIQLQSPENVSDVEDQSNQLQELKIYALTLSQSDTSFHLIHSIDTPASFHSLKSSVNIGEYVVASSDVNEEIWIPCNNPTSITYFCRPNTKRFYSSMNSKFIEVSEDSLMVETFLDQLLKLNR